MRNYEIATIIDVNEQVINSTKEKIKEYVKSLGGTVLKEDETGVKNLPYEMKKKEKGFYYYINIEIDPSKIVELEKEFRLNESILKYMTLVLSN